MVIKKTSSKKRTIYVYKSLIGKDDYVIIRPGENGVTEADIKMLHAEDDKEVYNNIKNLRPERTKKEKEEIGAWKNAYIERQKIQRGYEPSDDEVEEAVNERFPRNYNLSLDYGFENDDEDKSDLFYEIAKKLQTQEENSLIEEVLKFMSEMPKNQTEIIYKHVVYGMSFSDIAREKNTSPANIKQIYDRAILHIQKNFNKTS